MLVKHCESPKCNNDEMTPLFQNSCNTSCHIRAQPVTKSIKNRKEKDAATHDQYLPLILCLKYLNFVVH